MTRLIWDERTHEEGIDHGVVYPSTEHGVAWNGLLSVAETLSTETTGYFIDGVKRVNATQLDEYSAAVEAFTYPEILDDTQEIRGFAYRTKAGERYRIHLVYNPILHMSGKTRLAFAETPEALPIHFDMTSRPETLTGHAPVSQVIIEISELESYFLEYIEGLLYGTADASPQFPILEDLVVFATDNATHGTLIILDHGDGTWTAIGSDEMITMLDEDSFTIDSPSAIFIDSESYTISSL